MKTIKVKVKEKDLDRLRRLLKQHGFQEDSINKLNSPVDPISKLSELSLSEDWDSEEDDRYEKYFRQES